jgi:hypothetical protein
MAKRGEDRSSDGKAARGQARNRTAKAKNKKLWKAMDLNCTERNRSMTDLILWAIIESLRADGYEVTEIKGGEQIAGGM